MFTLTLLALTTSRQQVRHTFRLWTSVASGFGIVVNVDVQLVIVQICRFIRQFDTDKPFGLFGCGARGAGNLGAVNNLQLHIMTGQCSVPPIPDELGSRQKSAPGVNSLMRRYFRSCNSVGESTSRAPKNGLRVSKTSVAGL